MRAPTETFRALSRRCEGTLGDVPTVDYGYEDRLITRLDLRAIIAKSLSDRERRILHSRIRGSTLQDIGALEGISKGRVAQICDKTIRKLQWKAARKKQIPQPTKDFGEILREYPPAAPVVIPPPATWKPFEPQYIGQHTYLTSNMIAAEATRLWTNHRIILREVEARTIAPQPIPWRPGDLQRDRIIINVYWTHGGLIKKHHTERAAFAADMRDMMKIGDRIEVHADGALRAKLALHGDKWRLIEQSP